MLQIVVVDPRNTNGRGPARSFFDGLSGLLGDRFAAIPALFVEFSDPELANQVTQILSQAGETYYLLPEEAQEERAAIAAATAHIQEFAKREYAEMTESADLDRGAWMSPDPTPDQRYAWRETADAAEEDITPAEELLHIAEQEPAIAEVLEALQPVVPDEAEQAIETYMDAVLTSDGSKESMETVEAAEALASDAIWGPGGAVEKTQEIAKPKSKPRGSGKYPRTANLTNVCEHCHESFLARRRDQTYCSKPDCQKAKAAIYNKRYWQKRSKKQAEALEEARADATNQIEEKQVAAPVTEKPAPSQAKEVLFLRANGTGPTWTIEDGALADRLVKESELRKLLEDGDLLEGTHVRHPQRGQCKVIRFKGKHPHLALQQMYGKEALRLVDLAKE